MKKEHNYGEVKPVAINAELRQDLDNPNAFQWRINQTEQSEDANNILNSLNRRVYRNGVKDGVKFGLAISALTVYAGVAISELIKKHKNKKSKKEEKEEINA